MWTALIPLISTLLDKVITDPKAADEAKLKTLEMAQKGDLAQLDADVRLAIGQMEVNKVEAGTDIFRGGWRPFVGWTCGLGLFVQFVLSPFFTWTATMLGHPASFPQLDISTLMTLLFGMLGLGVMRTQEKLQGLK